MNSQLISGHDATKKLPGEGFKRPWPPLIKMDAAVKAKAERNVRKAMNKKKQKSTVRIDKDRVLEFTRAAEAGNVRLVRAFLKTGMDANCEYQGGRKSRSNALIGAVRNGHAEIVDLLLRYGADPSARAQTIERWGTPFEIDALGLAAEKGYLEIVRLLLKAGADVNKSIVYDLDALNAAAVEGHAKVVRELLKAGYLVNSSGGLKALDGAIGEKEEETALVLIAAGVRPQGENATNFLLTAAVKGMERVVKALLDAGVDPNLKNKFGKTALQGLKIISRQEVVWEGDNRNKKVAERIRRMLENAAIRHRARPRR